MRRRSLTAHAYNTSGAWMRQNKFLLISFVPSLGWPHSNGSRFPGSSSVEHYFLLSSDKLCKGHQIVHQIRQHQLLMWWLRSDSTITLSWTKRRPEELQTFVANRVADIQRIAPAAQWFHVRSKDNPADVLSLTTPEDLKNLQSWWVGASWLTTNRQNWPVEPPSAPDYHLFELKKQAIVFTCTSSSLELFNKFSSLSLVLNV